MDKYVTRPGIVLTSICGEYVLVAAKDLLEKCPYVTQLNDSSAFLWEKLSSGADADGLFEAVQAEFDIDDPAVIRQAIEDFIRQMREFNYLIPAEEKGETDE